MPLGGRVSLPSRSGRETLHGRDNQKDGRDNQKVGLALGGRAMFRRSQITARHAPNSSMASNSSS